MSELAQLLKQNFLKHSKNKNYSTQYSRVVSHHSTDRAVTSLTSEIGRDPVVSSAYGRSRKRNVLFNNIDSFPIELRSTTAPASTPNDLFETFQGLFD